jgi:hypothetical protein
LAKVVDAASSFRCSTRFVCLVFSDVLVQAWLWGTAMAVMQTKPALRSGRLFLTLNFGAPYIFLKIQ